MKKMMQNMEKKNLKKAVKKIKISFKIKKMTPDYPTKNGNKDKLKLIKNIQIRSLLFERQNLKC